MTTDSLIELIKSEKSGNPAHGQWDNALDKVIDIFEAHSVYEEILDLNKAIEKEERAHEQTISERDAAQNAADEMASLVLREPIDWAFHDEKWAEAIEKLEEKPSEISDNETCCDCHWHRTGQYDPKEFMCGEAKATGHIDFKEWGKLNKQLEAAVRSIPLHINPCPFCDGIPIVYKYYEPSEDDVTLGERKAQFSHTCAAINTTTSNLGLGDIAPSGSMTLAAKINAWNTRTMKPVIISLDNVAAIIELGFTTQSKFPAAVLCRDEINYNNIAKSVLNAMGVKWN